MAIKLGFILFFPTCLLLTATASNLTVQTPEFKTTGIEYYDANGTLVSHAFLGLPYAQPPIGNLRMEKPVALPVNNSRHVHETALPPGCVQQQDLGIPDFPVSEDCLYVNVMTPPEPSEDPEGYPILVWVHGGGFVYGMSRFYGWQTLARHFNPRKVIVVAFQYRLAFLGFFSLNDAHNPGNLGLWDQVAALRWTKDRIHLFGGNPARMTLWGNSAGSVSVQSLSISPHSRNLFQQSIQSSGSLNNFWSHTKKTYKISREVANAVGCTSTNSQQVKQCMKNVTVAELWQAVQPYGLMRNGMNEVLWTPVLNNDFYGGTDLKKLIKKAPKKPTIYGTTNAEGLVITLKTSNVVTTVFAYWTGVNVEDQAAYTKQNWTNHLNTYAVNNETAVNNRGKIKNIIKGYYERGQQQASSTNKFWYNCYTQFQTDSQLIGGITKEISDKVNLDWQQYVYLFQYMHPSHRPLVGYNDSIPHAYEYQYLTDGIPYFPINQADFNNQELAITERLVSGFTHFVKTGNPGTTANPWPVVNNGKKIKYLSLGENISIGNTFYNERAKVWRKLYKAGYGQEL